MLQQTAGDEDSLVLSFYLKALKKVGQASCSGDLVFAE